MKIELGGGPFPRGEGFLNVDLAGAADIQHDLNWCPWPIDTDTVDEVYSSHCMEHLREPIVALFEISRICMVGAKVTIRVPDAMSEGAMTSGHRGVLGEVFFRNVLEHFPPPDFKRLGKILRLAEVEPRADATWFPRARHASIFRDYSDLDILRWVPRACHEVEFRFVVEPCT